jgi:hypothetical protein
MNVLEGIEVLRGEMCEGGCGDVVGRVRRDLALLDALDDAQLHEAVVQLATNPFAYRATPLSTWTPLVMQAAEEKRLSAGTAGWIDDTDAVALFGSWATSEVAA